ncbi:hypothetical protein GTQ40_08220 [Flavobacteriaceae bacterium R38]|nr:hypothetical protein [Flavobacteriaceae bacterium R38]
MKIDFNLDFLYYQEKQILDATDPKMDELRPDIESFETYLKTTSILNIVALIVKSYSNNYPQEKYWYTKLLVENAYKINVEYPDNLDEEADLYAITEEIERNDIKHLILRRFDDFKNNSYFLNSLELAFIEPQNLDKLSEAIQRELGNISFSINNTNQQVIFSVDNSPISEIILKPDSFLLNINPNKRVRYFGG